MKKIEGNREQGDEDATRMRRGCDEDATKGIEGRDEGNRGQRDREAEEARKKLNPRTKVEE